MNKRSLWKDIFREIGHTKARFLSIFAIVMLGVGFFSGLRATGPDMLHTAHVYYRNTQLSDLKVQSSHGLTEESIDALEKVTRVQEVEPGYSAEVFLGDSGIIARIQSYSPDQKLNQYRITSGRLPGQTGEIALDDELGKSRDYSLGDTVIFTNQEASAVLDSSFRTLTYKVVGFVNSPEYIERANRGMSRIGKGTADAFGVIPEGDFQLPVYTQAYLSFGDTAGLEPYSAEYGELVQAHGEAVEKALLAVPQQSAGQGAPQVQVYVSDRTANPGYLEFKNNADRVSALATAFPVFFFLIAALVSLTTMTRMVEERRLQIGTLKALGYSNLEIMLKFLIYGTLASVAATIAGLAVGYTLFPPIIYNAYGELYNLPHLEIRFYTSYSVISLAVALLCTTMTVLVASRVELASNASVLMRPKSPKVGQRILLERVAVIWKRLSFVQKVTARNLFRYKQRMFMTVIGVAGCTALILTGFGLRDSIGNIVPLQFGEIMKYSVAVGFHEEAPPELRTAYEKLLDEESAITARLDVSQETMVVEQKGVNNQNVTIFVPAELSRIDEFIKLQDRHTGQKQELTEEGAVVSEKLAKLYGLAPGGTLSVLSKDNETFEVKIAAITENYVLHYLYMTPAYYASVFGEEPVYNSQMLLASTNDKAWEESFGEKLTGNGRVAMASFASSVGSAFEETVKSMDIVIVVLIVSAAALAFVVLYNLTNINVSERVRELSTIKVLGFYDQEVSFYIYRENILLTLLGTLAGSFLGKVLHRFVLKTAELDATMFSPVIKWQSYVFAAVLTFVFSGIVMAFMHLKLKRIDMIEALKSVE
ncbi:MAG: hypothetical protein K0R57_708 [Paenibacillaceae bacterium]|nr:hypothetical protein [Paenibacillaceae bacterium]